jgi:hypothetical protein
MFRIPGPTGYRRRIEIDRGTKYLWTSPPPRPAGYPSSIGRLNAEIASPLAPPILTSQLEKPDALSHHQSLETDDSVLAA